MARTDARRRGLDHLWISWRSAPDAMAIGTALAAAARIDRPGKQHRHRREHRLSLMPLRETSRHARGVHRHAVVFGEGLEHAHVVVAEISRVVLLRRQLESVFRERLLKGAEVQRLAVGYHPVEIEDDRLKRGGHVPGAFSPARISTFKRFEAGGYGQSYDAL